MSWRRRAPFSTARRTLQTVKMSETCWRLIFMRGMPVNTADHHSKYLARAVAALTPEGRRRVDELLDQLAVAGRSREWVVRFANGP